MNKKRPIVIKEVEPGSIAAEAGIEPCDVLVAVNGRKIRDIFDYRYLTTEEKLSLLIEKKSGEVWDIEVEKEQYEDLGLDFEDSLMDESKSCTNKCIFCFIDQLPKGMRPTVYFKDDDSRLSYLSGNYVTLTNMKKEDVERIIRYRMSPINVSVHTTNPELRRFMLGNRFAGDALEKIEALAAGGISVNAQIVLCRGINDKEELDRTISELAGLYPGVESVSVVPVGITRWREGLYALVPYEKSSAGEVIDQVEAWQKRLLERTGSRVVYLADEFYIMSGRKLPGYKGYEDFPQIENGVGLVAFFKQEFDACFRRLKTTGAAQAPRHVSIATGVLVYKFIKEMAERLEKRYNNLKVAVYPIKNIFFGENVTVAGLLTGGDIADRLKDEDLGRELLISRSMLKAGEEIFLDDCTVGMLEDKLGVKVTVVENNGEDFIKKILG